MRTIATTCSHVALGIALLLVGPGCATENDDGGSASQDALTGLGTTADYKKTADPDLFAAISNFESLGGHGGWFRSVSPFDGTQGAYYLVQDVPKKVNAHSEILLLRVEHQRAFLADLVAKGVPVVFGAFAQQTQVTAAALGGVQLSDDVAKKGGLPNAKNIIVLQPSASKYVVAHEYRHFQDYEDPKFEPSFQEALKPFLSASYLTADDKRFLLRVTWEIRGHARQRLQALEDLDAKLPYVDGIGNIFTGPPKKLSDSYGFEAAQATSIFFQAYQVPFLNLLDKIKKHDQQAGVDRCMAALSKFDFTDDPKNTLRFKKLAP